MASEESFQQQPPSFKEQLDHKASAARDPKYGKEDDQSGILGKVTKLMPAAAKILGTGSPSNGEESAANPSGAVPGPPNRPEHDASIEEFVRDQYRSKKTQDDELAGK
ncbi:hypothetical protein BX600DRAFT_292491 [Xylariales sp. PMI_506]|nr:hypothetical protein BX600DRAFT_292491 [Xylariales sp. PMI_506]